MHPDAAKIFKDTYLLDFLDLPASHSETDLQRALVEQLKQFLIELGRDCCFVGSHDPVSPRGPPSGGQRSTSRCDKRGGVEVSEAVIGADGTVELTHCRKFRLSDAMILLAGAALALSAGSHLLVLLAEMLGRLCREVMAHRADVVANWPLFWGATHDSLRNTLWYAFQVVEMFLFGMTPAFFAIRLRRPRPPLRTLLRQPGTVAGLAMVFGLFWGTGGLLWSFPGMVDTMTAAPTAVGGAVAIGWIAVALSRWWKPEAGWVDQIGRVLGCAAIGAALLGLMVFRI